jgi:hypothetical protein
VAADVLAFLALGPLPFWLVLRASARQPLAAIRGGGVELHLGDWTRYENNQKPKIVGSCYWYTQVD